MDVLGLGPFLCEYLETEAQKARLHALQKLEDVSPADTLAVAALQVEARAARLALQWLAEAVQRGKLAEDQLRQQDEDRESDA